MSRFIFCCYEYVVLQECILYFSTLASCDPIPLHGVARARPLLCGLHQNPLCFSQCWPMHLFTFLVVSTPLFVFSCVFVYFAFTHLCFSGQYTFLLLWVCACNSFCATVLARYFRLGGRPPGGRNLWRTFDVPNPRNNLPERRPPQPITRSAIACECAALAQAIFTWLTKDFFFLASCSSSFFWI